MKNVLVLKNDKASRIEKVLILSQGSICSVILPFLAAGAGFFFKGRCRFFFLYPSRSENYFLSILQRFDRRSFPICTANTKHNPIVNCFNILSTV